MVKGFKDDKGKFRPTGKVTVSEVSLKDLSDEKLQKGIDNRKRLPKHLVDALFREKTRRSKFDICGVCGAELKDKGACKRCEADLEKRAKNWSTMTIEQRKRFLETHGLENENAIFRISLLPHNKLTNFWKEELKDSGFDK